MTFLWVELELNNDYVKNFMKKMAFTQKEKRRKIFQLT